MKAEICSICRENECDFETRCRHFFHLKCLEAAFKGNHDFNCPTCTKGISINNEIENILQDPSKPSEKALISNLSKGYLDEIGIHIIKTNDFDAYKATISLGLDRHADINLAFRLSAQNGHMEDMKYLIDLGADIHTDNDYALRNSAQNGHKEMVEYLLELGSDIHANNDDALVVSAGNGHMEIVKYLIDLGADIR